MKQPYWIGLLVIIAVHAQQTAAPQAAAARPPAAPPPIIWPSPPLADGPIVLDTGIQHQIRLIVTKGLNQPWSMAASSLPSALDVCASSVMACSIRNQSQACHRYKRNACPA